MSNETVEAKCNNCNWTGSSDLCEENDWGELTCPECGEPIELQ
jgi:Zn finger protein HypA/HybF involved in hydrogenase expression